MFKKVLIGAMIMLFTLCSSTVIATKDWKTCNTEVIMANTLHVKMVYRVLWIDHDVEELKGIPIERCGGGIEPYSFSATGSDFRLCPGRHIAIWWGNGEKETYYEFIVTKNITQIVITPTVAIMK